MDENNFCEINSTDGSIRRPEMKESSTPDKNTLCLKWNDYQSNLTDVFDSLLQQEAFVDVTLSTEVGKSLKCHKVVLSACSAYFRNLFVENPCQHPIVILRDVEWLQLKRIVEYMYKGQIRVPKAELDPLLRSAESLQIRGLVDIIRVLEENEERRREEEEIPTKRRRSDSSPKRHDSPPREASSPPLSPHPSPFIHPPSSLSPNVRNEDLSDVKPGIMEMIQEEQRAKMIEASQITQNWMAAAAAAAAASGTSPSATPQDNNNVTYQYQLQSMWQKCWNQNTAAAASLLQQAGIRYRERGPMKSWRPETMAEAIWSVLHEGLSLSQAARKHDIPYPTFVLYANRVHNMLGPSRNGGSPALGELRPKGRGRPQRILLGKWPESHVRQVIRAVVFRESGASNYPSNEDSFALPRPREDPSTSSLRPPSTNSERAYSPPRSGKPGTPPTTDLQQQLKQLYGNHTSPKSLMNAVAAMGGPLSELIMKEIDFDPVTLKALLRLHGGASGMFEDAVEDKKPEHRSSVQNKGLISSLALNPEVILTEMPDNSKESYDNIRPQDLISAGSSNLH